MQEIGGIPKNKKERIVIIGGGFAGLKLAQSLKKSDYQIVLIDKNNYHQFQPLFYQVATAGLEPSAISFPVRKAFQNQQHIHFRIANVEEVQAENNVILTDIGQLTYDYLVLAMGADTNYFGNTNIENHAVPMKSLSEAIQLRNTILERFEQALSTPNEALRRKLLNFVIVGGGPTGVELAGAIAEMKKYILPKDYPEMDFSQMNIYLLEASAKVLGSYSEASSHKSESYLRRLGVEVLTNTFVKDYDGNAVLLANGATIEAQTLIWAAGIKGNTLKGINDNAFTKNGRIVVDPINAVERHDNIFAIGDLAYMKTEAYPNGHPQVAQVAIQQASRLAKNLIQKSKGGTTKPFKYKDKGSLATVGRNLAVADLPGLSFQGFFAWILWLFVHLMAILGVKNRLFVFLNWAWSYVTYDQSLRLLIRPDKSIQEKKVTNENDLHPAS